MTDKIQPVADLAASTIIIYGQTIHIMSVLIFIILAGVFLLFYRIHQSGKLDFADMITKDGHSVSLTKVLQLIGGLCGTWVVIKMAMGSTLTFDIFTAYLTYVGAIEGYSKFVAAKYGYKEGSVKNQKISSDEMDSRMPSQ